MNEQKLNSITLKNGCLRFKLRIIKEEMQQSSVGMYVISERERESKTKQRESKTKQKQSKARESLRDWEIKNGDLKTSRDDQIGL